MGRTARGVRGMRLEEGDSVISLLAADDAKEILTITEKGYGKRTNISEYRLCNRGSKGVTNIKTTEKNGPAVVARVVDGSEDLMVMSKHGIAIRVACANVSKIGRATQGVRVMRMKESDIVAAAAIIGAEEEAEEEDVELPREITAELLEEAYRMDKEFNEGLNQNGK